MEIKVVIALDERTHETLNRLADALTKEMTIKVADSQATHEKTPKNASVSNGKKKAEEELKKKPDGENKPVSDGVAGKDEEWTDAEKAEALKAAEESGDWTDNTDQRIPIVPIEELRGLAADVKTKKGTSDPVKKLLEKFGAKKLSDIPEEKTAAFANGLKEILDA